MPHRLIFATHNSAKAAEIQAALPPEFNLLSLADLDYHQEIPETGDTLEENARIKAMTIFNEFQLPCFADDTGLEVEALNGEPGVYSARFAGEKASYSDNCNLLLYKLKGNNNRKASFRTVICYVDETGRDHLFEGRIDGSISEVPQGNQGFGYDPLFIPTGQSGTFAQMSLDQKNQISHRSKAFHEFLSFLNSK